MRAKTTALTKQEILAVVRADLPDPFQFLGMHPTSDGFVEVRAFCPGASSMIMVPDQGSPAPMTRLHDHGMFVYRTPKKADPFAYRLTVTRGDISWTTRDPYCYLPQLGEMDLHLFNEGRHLDLHRIMGARVKTVGDTSGVLFSVWAPNARAASVVGNFNDWDRRRHPMRSRGVSGVWELFIPGVVPGDMYKFSILSSQGRELIKADPFALRSQMRPETASMVADPFTYNWNDGEWMEGRSTVNPFSARMSIYEVHAMSWAGGESGFPGWERLGDWLIPYLGSMGFTHVELMPVMEHPFDGSWGYQVTGFFAPTSRMGSPEDFCGFVERCHRNNIGVILDWTPAHFPMDDWALARFDGTHLFEHEDPRLGLHPDWGTLIFNFGRREVRNFLLASAIHWLDTFHVDGLRVDAVASMLYLDYSRKDGQWLPNRYGGRENIEAASLLREICHEIGSRFPGAVMIAEESTAWPGVTRPPESGGLGFHFKWNMGWMNDTLEYFSRDPLFRKSHTAGITFSAVYAWSENFILPLSHDEVVHGKGSLYGKMPGDDFQKRANLRLLLAYQWLFPGKQLLFMGGERVQQHEWNPDEPLPAGDTRMERFVAALNSLQDRHPQLHLEDCLYSGFRWVDFSDEAASVISFLRLARDHPSMICVFNMTPVLRNGYRIGAPSGGMWQVVHSTDAEEFGGSGHPIPECIQTGDSPMHGMHCSVELNIPPLSCLVLLHRG
jgi:1,4-alpha-glucan branching enzyme